VTWGWRTIIDILDIAAHEGTSHQRHSISVEGIRMPITKVHSITSSKTSAANLQIVHSVDVMIAQSLLREKIHIFKKGCRKRLTFERNTLKRMVSQTPIEKQRICKLVDHYSQREIYLFYFHGTIALSSPAGAIDTDTFIMICIQSS
jgi:hypothetical protein